MAKYLYVVFPMIAALLAVGVVQAASPTEVEGTTTVDEAYRIIGFSVATTTGTEQESLGGMHEICRAEFGGLARMCTTLEAAKSPNLADLPELSGWMQPLITSTAVMFDPIQSEFGTPYRAVQTDVTNIIQVGLADTFRKAVFHAELSCNRWSPQALTTRPIFGAAVVNRKFAAAACSFKRSVLCCTPGSK